MAEQSPSNSQSISRLRALIAFFERYPLEARKRVERRRQERLARNAGPDFGRRPPGWIGHWSARYGEVLARTINLNPPYTQTQSELLAEIPQPMREALDPVASVAEPMDRDGKLRAWRFARSAIFDFFGPIGIVVGVLAFAVVTFATAVRLLGLPPLMAAKSDLTKPTAPPPTPPTLLEPK